MIVVFIVLVKDGSILLVVIYSPAAGFAPFLFLIIFFNFIIMITIPSLFRASLSLVKLVKCVHEVLAIETRAGFRL